MQGKYNGEKNRGKKRYSSGAVDVEHELLLMAGNQLDGILSTGRSSFGDRM
jgi:hypothetical protein